VHCPVTDRRRATALKTHWRVNECGSAFRATDHRVQGSTFSSAAELSSWVGTFSGKDQSAEENHSSRSDKGNRHLRRVLNQAAHAAVNHKGTYFQALFRCLLPRAEGAEATLVRLRATDKALPPE